MYWMHVEPLRVAAVPLMVMLGEKVRPVGTNAVGDRPPLTGVPSDASVGCPVSAAL